MRRIGQSGRVLGLFEELADRHVVAGVEVDDPELIGEPDGLADAGDRRLGARLDVRGQHLLEVHPVHVVGADHHHDVGLLVVDEVQRLQDGVCRAREPALAQTLLRRHRGHVGVQQSGHPPGLGHVPVEAVRLVLRQHHDLPKSRIDQVRDREVDQPVLAAEGHRGFGSVLRQRHEALSLAAGEDDSEDLRRCRHVTTLGPRSTVY